MNRSTSKQAGQSSENSEYSSVWGGKKAGLMFGLPSSSRISQALGHVAKAGLGTAMLYELIEVRGLVARGDVLSFKGSHGLES